MNLREQYETLLRRGMQNHLTLKCEMADSDAADLITMHALRWLQSMSHFGTVESFSVIEIGGNVSIHWIQRGEREPRKAVGHGTILDAILAATKHLEPI